MITCWRSLYEPERGARFTDQAIVSSVEAPRSYATKQAIGRWAGAIFHEGYRDTAHFERAGWIVLDFDRGATIERVRQAFGALTGFAHSTWTAGRWRVSIRLDRDVTLEEHPRIWRAVAAVAEANALEPDYAASSPAHCFALPANREHYQYAILDGALFDVEAALVAFPKPSRPPEPARTEVTGDAIVRARRYIAEMPHAISGSGGHRATFAVALVLVRGFGLNEDDALRVLVEDYNPRCLPPWTERDLRHKVRQATRRGRAEHGYLANRRR
jgi:hypothetical protein